MRKLLPVLLLCSTCSPLFAQIKKGSTLAGAQFYYYSVQDQYSSAKLGFRQGVFNVSLGKAFKENKIAGLTLTYVPIKETSIYSGSDTGTITFNRIDAGGFYREYKKLAKDLYFFGEINGVLITGKRNDNYRTGDVKVTQLGGDISFAPGISYKAFRKIFVEVDLPGFIEVGYLATNVASNNSGVQSKKEHELYLSSTVKRALGGFGVGMRFVF